MIFFWYEESSSALRYRISSQYSFLGLLDFVELEAEANLEADKHGMCLVH